MKRQAYISECGRYRYWLARAFDSETMKDPLVVIGLNPSTADDKVDDPTIRRCVGFARSWGHDGLVMLNLFALRSTDPRALYEDPAVDAVGAENDRWLSVLTGAPVRTVLCAWGVGGRLLDRGKRVTLLLLDADRPLVCLGFTKDGHPKHPLYIPKTTAPMPFTRC